MSDNAWHRSHGLRAFPDVSNRPAWLSDGEHGGQAAAEGQRGHKADDSGANDELLEPARYQNREFYLLLDARWKHMPVRWIPFVYVDNDSAMASVRSRLAGPDRSAAKMQSAARMRQRCASFMGNSPLPRAPTPHPTDLYATRSVQN